MVYIGLVYQYNADEQSGLIMLSDGSNKTFTNDDWVDRSNSPSVGQKIVYKNSANGIEVKVAMQDDINEASSAKKESKSVDEHLEYYISLGFKLVKDIKNDASRVLTLRSFARGESEEVIIKEDTSKIDIVRTLNGKVVS
ncbi:MAG: hypothetical protein Q9M34_07365 [Sulfurimonas sp.]|nr:hypothetical protein [Sulfurimonas sp.]